MPYLTRNKTLYVRISLWLFGCAATLCVVDRATAQNIQQATHNAVLAPTDLSQAGVIRFQQQEARVGDRVTQQVAMDLSLQGSVIQAGQLAGSQDASMKTWPRACGGSAGSGRGDAFRRARVTFPHSRQQLPEVEGGKEIVQPVEGKTYLLTRDGERLIVKYTDGTIPPAEEFEIVFGSLQSLGRPNPLAEFLLNRGFRIGESIELPLSLAQQMLGFGSELGEVTRFELTLKEDQGDRGSPLCGVRFEYPCGRHAAQSDFNASKWASHHSPRYLPYRAGRFVGGR